VLTNEAAALIAAYDLAPHPEGGYYREVFRSPHDVVDVRGATRSALTVIYFLLTAGQVSAWHRLQADETWHFARGDELEIAVIDGGSHPVMSHIGPDGPYVTTMPAGHPFAARVRAGGAYALVTCCVAPGFEFEDFELLDPVELQHSYPGVADTIAAFVP